MLSWFPLLFHSCSSSPPLLTAPLQNAKPITLGSEGAQSYADPFTGVRPCTQSVLYPSCPLTSSRPFFIWVLNPAFFPYPFLTCNSISFPALCPLLSVHIQVDLAICLDVSTFLGSDEHQNTHTHINTRAHTFTHHNTSHIPTRTY